eukprot:2641170-Pyramimonas_sp.AAC.3
MDAQQGGGGGWGGHCCLLRRARAWQCLHNARPPSASSISAEGRGQGLSRASRCGALGPQPGAALLERRSDDGFVADAN